MSYYFSQSASQPVSISAFQQLADEVGFSESPVAKRDTKCYFPLHMKSFAWNNEKNEQLKQERQISFEAVLFHIQHGDLLDVLEHPNQAKYQGQKIFVVQIDEYVYLVPFVEADETLFLKTIIPSRKATRQYLR